MIKEKMLHLKNFLNYWLVMTEHLEVAIIGAGPEGNKKSINSKLTYNGPGNNSVVLPINQ